MQDELDARVGNVGGNMKTTAIVLSGGRGTRMKSDVPKQYIEVNGKPILYYSLKAIEDSFIDEIILVAGQEDISFCQEEIVKKYGFEKISHVVAGGKERYHSVMNGMAAIKEADVVFIHDGARPMVNQEILERCLLGVQETGACVTGVPVKDTIKIVDDNKMVEATPPRNKLYQVQTPQVFFYSLIKNAYQKLKEQETALLQKGISITDDAMLVETLTDKKVKIVMGAYENIKVTTPEDLELVRNFLPI